VKSRVEAAPDRGRQSRLARSCMWFRFRGAAL